MGYLITLLHLQTFFWVKSFAAHDFSLIIENVVSTLFFIVHFERLHSPYASCRPYAPVCQTQELQGVVLSVKSPLRTCYPHFSWKIPVFLANGRAQYFSCQLLSKEAMVGVGLADSFTIW